MSKIYLLIIAMFASLIAWASLVYLRPTILETSCSEIAVKGSDIFNKEKYSLDQEFSYEKVKSRCMNEANVD